MENEPTHFVSTFYIYGKKLPSPQNCGEARAHAWVDMVSQTQSRSTKGSAVQFDRPQVLATSGQPKATPRGSRKLQSVTRNTNNCTKFKRCAHSMEVFAMKKLALAVLFVALVGTLAMAQYTGTISGPLTYAPT